MQVLPGPDTDGRPVLVMNAWMIAQGINQAACQKMGAYLMAHLTRPAHVQRRGVTVLVDFGSMGLGQLLANTAIEDVRRGAAMWRQAFPVRLKRIIVANPRTLVVLNIGAPVETPWAAGAAAVGSGAPARGFRRRAR